MNPLPDSFGAGRLFLGGVCGGESSRLGPVPNREVGVNLKGSDSCDTE